MRARQHRNDGRGALPQRIILPFVNSRVIIQITLRGRVLAVGDIKEKVLGAHRANITTVILPKANRKHVKHDVPPEVQSDMQFVYVRSIKEALAAAFHGETFASRSKA